jgi:hypothetical protein
MEMLYHHIHIHKSFGNSMNPSILVYLVINVGTWENKIYNIPVILKCLLRSLTRRTLAMIQQYHFFISTLKPCPLFFFVLFCNNLVHILNPNCTYIQLILYLGLQICITGSTSAGLHQILPWLYYHNVIGVSHFFLLVEGEAAKPAVTSVLESIQVNK